MSSGEGSQPYGYGVGLYGSKFLHELTEHHRITGIRCPKWRKRYMYRCARSAAPASPR